jgi:hypothetical protein
LLAEKYNKGYTEVLIRYAEFANYPFWFSATFVTFITYVAENLPVLGFIDGLSGGIEPHIYL